MINFKSKITQKVLGYFFVNPHAEMYLNEMVRKFDIDRGNLVKKLAEWEKEGLLIKNKKGNLSLYRINRNYPFLREIKRIFEKSFGLENILRENLKKVKGIRTAVIFGSYAKDRLSAESDIDLLLIGDHSAIEAQKAVLSLQKRLEREFNIIDLTEKEFAQRKKKGDEFIRNIFEGKVVKII